MALLLACVATGLATAQTETTVPGPGQISAEATNGTSTNAPATNAPPVQAAVPAAAPALPLIAQPLNVEAPSLDKMTAGLPAMVLGALLAFTALGGFLLYYCGLARAKNSGHTATLLLVAVMFGLTGYWIGGFAVQEGGIGDGHAALPVPLPSTERNALNHELGLMMAGHHWGMMGSSGFFLATDDATRNAVAALFLLQAALVAISIGAALGAALERGKLLAMGFCAYLTGVLVYPLYANWVWGGGWLAELGREFGLGHGFIDLGGAAVVHLSAGILALVFAIVIGPRHGRFGRNGAAAIPGHNVPLVIAGTLMLLVAFTSANAAGAANLPPDAAAIGGASSAGLAAADTLLAAMGGLVAAFIQAAVQKSKPTPARLCRGLLGGAVASSGGAGLFDPWAAFVIGCIAALLVQQVIVLLEKKRIDDPAGAAAVHGAGGAWGLLAVGFFASGTAGDGFNGVNAPIRGLFFGGAWHQLAAQVIGGLAGFVIVCILGYACVNLVQKILGNRVDLVNETEGLDQVETGALGYQGDVEPEDDTK